MAKLDNLLPPHRPPLTPRLWVSSPRMELCFSLAVSVLRLEESITEGVAVTQRPPVLLLTGSSSCPPPLHAPAGTTGYPDPPFPGRCLTLLHPPVQHPAPTFIIPPAPLLLPPAKEGCLSEPSSPSCRRARMGLVCWESRAERGTLTRTSPTSSSSAANMPYPATAPSLLRRTLGEKGAGRKRGGRKRRWGGGGGVEGHGRRCLTFGLSFTPARPHHARKAERGSALPCPRPLLPAAACG